MPAKAPALAAKRAPAKASVLAAGNGKSHSSSGDEFEEF
jgi:hypothetical protein